MKSKYLFVFVLVLLLAWSLAACERSASAPPEDEAAFPTLAGTQDTMETLGIYATQTAVAAEAEGASEAPPEEAAPEEQPAAEEAETPAEPAEEPAPEEAAPVVPESYPVPDTYTLQKGEFPYCIARRFDIAPAALLQANGLTNGSTTYPGQELKIPKTAGAFNAGARSLRTHPGSYTVQAGDTVYSIACLYGDVDPRAIEAANGLSGAYSLNVGQSIQIP
jgi:LysM repeat protein